MKRKAKGKGLRKNTRRSQFESLEKRWCMASSVGWDGPGLGSASLNYYVGTVPATLDRGQVETALKSALDAWGKVADISFRPTSLPQQLNSIDFTFRAIDGVGRAIAQGYFPNDLNPARIAGDIQFDSAESWEIGNGRGSSAFDLVQVAVHEVGHALGLDHLTATNSVMFPSVSPHQTYSGLGTADKNAILSLYAAADGVENTPTTTTTPTTPTARGRRGRNGRVEAEQLFAAANRWQNARDNQDVSGDGIVTSRDALLVINNLNRRGVHELNDAEGEPSDEGGFVDCNGDGSVTPLDALKVINRLNDEQVAMQATLEVEDVPGEDTSTSDTPEVDDCEPLDMDEQDGSDDDTDTEACPDDQTDTDETPTDDGTDETPTDETPTDETPTDETPTDETPTDDNETPTDDEPDVPTDDGGTTDDDEDEDEERCNRADDRIAEILSQYDENKDGSLTEDELPERLWNKLSEADTDEDGAISAAELENFHPRRPRGPHVDLFAEFDANEDGLLTEDELTEELWTRISAADADGDGAVSIAELAAFRPRHEHTPRGDLFAQFDVNEDGLLMADEVTERVWTKLSLADADDDGAVSVAELADYIPPPGERHGPREQPRHGGGRSRGGRR
jgi:Ca2+-binding EF-hand superfamily protein